MGIHREGEYRMNILILSVGAKCQLVKYFMDRHNGFDKVVTTDYSQYAPALYLSDKRYNVPLITDINYVSVIKQICIKEKIDAILPLNESELKLMADNIDVFKEINSIVIVSTVTTIQLCNDKYELFKFLRSKDIPCVDTYDCKEDINENADFKFPVIVKERCGAGSIGMLKIKTPTLLQAYIEEYGDDLIIQPYIDATEYGVDAYIDVVSGEIISIFIKEKIRMKAGETEKSRSVKDEAILEIVNRLVKKIPFKGPIDIDILKADGKYYVLEINPRFGGGYPHAYECGVNFAEYISKNAGGISNIPRIGQYEIGNIMLKYTTNMIINQ